MKSKYVRFRRVRIQNILKGFNSCIESLYLEIYQFWNLVIESLNDLQMKIIVLFISIWFVDIIEIL